MTAAPPPVESVFARSWALLNANWIIIVPGVVVGLVVGILQYLAQPPVAVYDAGGTVLLTQTYGLTSVFAGFLVGLLALVGTILTIAYTTGMAAAAWARGATTLHDGANAWRADGAQIFLAMIGLVVLAAVAAVLSIPTIGLAMLAFVLFTLYTMPAVIIGKQRGFSAIIESFRLTAARFVPTLIVALLLAAVFIVLGLVGKIFSIIPFLGPLISGIIQQAVAAYATLVIVGEYLVLSRSTPVVAPATQFQSQYQSQPHSPVEPPL